MACFVKCVGIFLLSFASFFTNRIRCFTLHFSPLSLHCLDAVPKNYYEFKKFHQIKVLASAKGTMYSQQLLLVLLVGFFCFFFRTLFAGCLHQ